MPEDYPDYPHHSQVARYFDDFERRISRETNTFILCNPQNPTGTVHSSAELAAWLLDQGERAGGN